MKNNYLILILILGIIFLSGCIQSDTSKINELAPNINNHIKQGDKSFNDAAWNTNNFNYQEASQNCANATSEFNLAKSSANEANNLAKNTGDSVYIQYFGLVLNEIDAKLSATSELNLAIQYFAQGDNETANSYVSSSNDFMSKAVEYMDQKEVIVNNNPSKFQ
ncbi:MAG: hypothetical protein ACP5C3_03390 [Methanomicrobiales archaeon]